MDNAAWLKNRKIAERIVIRGDLVLTTPARFGNGDAEGPVDMPLALDPLENVALLTGASIAGALRSYLRQRELGYWQAGDVDSLNAALFGVQIDDTGEQSLLIVDDARGSTPFPRTELRDGVAIDPCTRTAEDQKKYDFSLLAAGATFPLRFELLVPDDEDLRARLLQAVAIVLGGLQHGEIPLGARKRRGFGECTVQQWQMIRYNLRDSKQLCAWLEQDQSGGQLCKNLPALLGIAAPDLDRREQFVLDATFAVPGSLLIRSGVVPKSGADMAHLESYRNGHLVPVVSGTSLAGVLHGRAVRIARTLDRAGNARRFIDDLFGPDLEQSRARQSDDASDSASPRPQPRASRIVVGEAEVKQPLKMVQQSVAIDRFTGGSYPTALFSKQPIYGRHPQANAQGQPPPADQRTTVRFKMALQQPTAAQIGLLLLLLKDLWTCDLAVGGESSLGRGRLEGLSATLTLARPPRTRSWQLDAQENGLAITGNKPKALQRYVKAFNKVMEEQGGNPNRPAQPAAV